MDKNLFRLECVRLAAELPIVSASNLGSAEVLIQQAKRLFEFIYSDTDAGPEIEVIEATGTAH